MDVALVSEQPVVCRQLSLWATHMGYTWTDTGHGFAFKGQTMVQVVNLGAFLGTHLVPCLCLLGPTHAPNTMSALACHEHEWMAPLDTSQKLTEMGAIGPFWDSALPRPFNRTLFACSRGHCGADLVRFLLL
jgi:hypothetical protein